MSRGGITLRKFEPIKPEKEVISLRLDTRMLQEINDWAMEIDISRNEFINQCIDFALKNIDTELIEQVERRHNGRGGVVDSEQGLKMMKKKKTRNDCFLVFS